MSVRVRVPATIANLGPGFDCLGCAVAIFNVVEVAEAATTTIDVEGHGADRIPRDDSNLVLRAIRAWEHASGRERREYEIRIHNDAPYGRGFGSSAAAIVGGLIAARALRGGDADVLAPAGEIEGHLDNVAPALMGGVVVSGFSSRDAMRIEPPPGMLVLACIAAERLSTEKARGALPAGVSRADAVFNASRTALLAACLATGDTERLLEATRDRLHQQHRFALSPDSGTLVESLRGDGFAAFLSGAGPSVAAFVESERAGDAERIARAVAPAGWEIRIVPFDQDGAAVVERSR